MPADRPAPRPAPSAPRPAPRRREVLRLPAPAPAAAYHHLAGTLATLEGAVRHGLAGSAFIPAEWEAVAQVEAVPAKEKLTLRLDGDVVRFFRLMGTGWQTQANRVLRAFMLARLSGVVRGAEAVQHGPTALERYLAEGAAVVEALQARNERAAAGQDTAAEDLRLTRRMRALEALAEEAGVPEEERLRM